MKNKTLIKMMTLAMAAGITFAPAVTTLAANPDTAATSSAAIANDLANGDIHDTAQTGSLTIFKYDITAAEAAGDYKEGTYKATGEKDSRVEKVLGDYGIEGVQFSYLRVGDVETHSLGSSAGTAIELVYEIPTDLAKLLKLAPSDAVDMTSEKEAHPCNKAGVLHYTSQQVADALEALLQADDVTAKNKLEAYFYNAPEGISHLPKTDQTGYTTISGLELGLYLIVETEVPENVTKTVNPWFAQLPFTNVSADTGSSTDGGQRWLYDMTCYPKNQTGNPTLDKSVRADASDFGDTATASEGDTLDYILVSKIPHISSTATYLSEYTFADQLSAGLVYNKDVQIAFYSKATDANVNNTAEAALIWSSEDSGFTATYEAAGEKGSKMTVSFTEAGLKKINSDFSDYYVVVSYTADVRSDDAVILGDEGNPNDVSLIWSRTSDSYYNLLEDRNYVYSYGLDLTKEFSDHQGKFENVQFKLYNGTDEYYVIAEKAEDGLYYVTGETVDATEATAFVPNAKTGSLVVNGIEADTYQLTEVATDDGYNLLKDQIVINITPTDREVIASVAGVTGMDAAAVEAIVKNYNGGIYTENGELATASKDELTGESANTPSEETPDGRTIGKTDMYVGTIQCASATVDGIDAEMNADGTSAHAAVALSVMNTKGFQLPQTGGDGLYAVTILGMITVAGGCYLVTRKRKTAQ